MLLTVFSSVAGRSVPFLYGLDDYDVIAVSARLKHTLWQPPENNLLMQELGPQHWIMKVARSAAAADQTAQPKR